MNENQAQQLYQEIFREDRIERWEIWQRDGYTKGGVRTSVRHPLADCPIKKTKICGVIYINGYRLIFMPSHPRATTAGCYVFEHILICDIVIGRFLMPPAVVHHSDEVRDNNVPGNLVICQDSGHHREIHRRMAAQKECGNPCWIKCSICGHHDNPDNMYVFMGRGRHRECRNSAQRERYSSCVSNS